MPIANHLAVIARQERQARRAASPNTLLRLLKADQAPMRPLKAGAAQQADLDPVAALLDEQARMAGEEAGARARDWQRIGRLVDRRAPDPEMGGDGPRSEARVAGMPARPFDGSETILSFRGPSTPGGLPGLRPETLPLDERPSFGERFRRNWQAGIFGWDGTADGLAGPLIRYDETEQDELDRLDENIRMVEQRIAQAQEGWANIDRMRELNPTLLPEQTAGLEAQFPPREAIAEDAATLDDLRRQREEFAAGPQRQAQRAWDTWEAEQRAAYEAMPARDGFVDSFAALGGRIGSGLTQPENLTGGAAGRGATLLGTYGRNALAAILGNAAVEPLIQQDAIDRGEQDGFDWLDAAGNVAMGGVLGGVLGGAGHAASDLGAWIGRWLDTAPEEAHIGQTRYSHTPDEGGGDGPSDAFPPTGQGENPDILGEGFSSSDSAGSAQGGTDKFGNPLHAEFVIGRQPFDPTGLRRPLSPEGGRAILDRLANRVDYEATLPPGYLGIHYDRPSFWPFNWKEADRRNAFARRQWPKWREVKIRAGQSPEGAEETIRHEGGHLIESVAGEFTSDEIKPLRSELQAIYEAVNGAGETPYSMGYGQGDWDAEYIADAVNFMGANPDAMEVIGPNVADLLRLKYNAHPVISRIIQFNQLAPWLIPGAGMAAIEGSPDDRPAVPVSPTMNDVLHFGLLDRLREQP